MMVEEIQDIRNEVDVLHHLCGHPNVVKLEEVFEDKNDVCLVLELMRGGELFEVLTKRNKPYSEVDAAALIRDIVTVVAKCHAESIIHRDIKVSVRFMWKVGSVSFKRKRLQRRGIRVAEKERDHRTSTVI